MLYAYMDDCRYGILAGVRTKPSLNLARTILLVTASLLSIWISPYVSPEAHATGNLYIDPSNQPTQAVGAVVSYHVKVSGMDAFNAWDVIVQSDPNVLSPQNISITNNIFGTIVFEAVNCVSSGTGIPTGQPGDIGCDITEGPGIVRSSVIAIGFQSIPGASGLLFTINYQVVSEGFSQIRITRSEIANGGPTLVDHATTEGSYGTLPGAIPTAEFTWTPPHPMIGDEIRFNASASSDDPSNQPSGIATYRWVFTGGQGGEVVTTLGPYINHTFTRLYGSPIAGNFTVTLTVTDQLGLLSAISHTVAVSLPPPPCPKGLSSIQVPKDCPTIQSGINSIIPGGTISVAPGSYTERLRVPKPVILKGAGRDKTFLTGSISVTANNVSISGFNLALAGPPRPITSLFDNIQLSVNARLAKVFNNTIYGSIILQSAPGSVVTDNILTAGGLGVFDSGGSKIHRNVLHGLVLGGNSHSNFILSLDPSNSINGKPVYYFVGATNPVIPADAGYVAFIDCSNVVLTRRSFNAIEQAILLVSSKNAIIDHATASGGEVDILNSTSVSITNGFFQNSAFVIVDSASGVIMNNTIGSVRIRESQNIRIVGNELVKTQRRYFDFSEGIDVSSSRQVVIAGNHIAGYAIGISLLISPSNQLLDNMIQDDASLRLTSSAVGMIIENSPNNVLRNNRVSGAFSSIEVSSSYPNECVFQNQCHHINDFVQRIDTSNTVDGRPVYYLVGARDTTIPSNAGYIAVVNSHNVRIRGAQLSYPGNGIQVVSSEDVLVEDANIASSTALTGLNVGVWAWRSSDLTVRNSRFAGQGVSYAGIMLEDSSMATVSGNIVRDFQAPFQIDLVNTTYSTIEGNIVADFHLTGINLLDSSNNAIGRNTVFGWKAFSRGGFPVGSTGVWILSLHTSGPDHNRIIGNTIANNLVGLKPGTGDTIYHNNFIDNIFQAADHGDTWDNGAGQGNYWSDYSGRDLDGDGVGDTLIPHLGLDSYPLITPWSPQGLALRFSGRGAWAGKAESRVTDRNSLSLALFARAKNTGQGSEWVRAVFTITSPSGSVLVLHSLPAWLPTDQAVTLSTSIQNVPGIYLVKVELQYSSDALLNSAVGATMTFTLKITDGKAKMLA